MSAGESSLRGWVSRFLLAGLWIGLSGCGPESASLPWLTDFPKAQTQARQEKKLILMDFTGSDWCPPCKKLKRYVLDTKEFAGYSSSNLVLLEVDFPRWDQQTEAQQKANQELQSSYQVEAYPTLIVLSSGGAVLGRQVGAGQSKPAELIAWIEELRTATKRPAGGPNPP